MRLVTPAGRQVHRFHALFATPSFRDDLHLVARLERVALVDPVDDQEPLERAVDQRHAGGEAFRRVAVLHRDDVQLLLRQLLVVVYLYVHSQVWVAGVLRHR